MALAHSPSIVTNGLVLYLDAANRRSYSGTGTTWIDLSGNGNNGTLESATYSNNSIIFDGVNDWISTTFNPNLDNTRLYTYELWFKDNSAGGFASNTALISNYQTATTAASELHINETGTVRFRERNSDSNSVVISASTISVTDNKWHNIVLAAYSNKVSLYINGILNSEASPRPGGIITSGQNFIIGGNHLTRFQSCNISLVKIYLDKALTADEVRQNYDALKGRYI